MMQTVILTLVAVTSLPSQLTARSLNISLFSTPNDSFSLTPAQLSRQSSIPATLHTPDPLLSLTPTLPKQTHS